MKTGQNSPNRFVKIPYAVIYNTELNDAQKILLSQVIALANTRNYCYANNHHLARLLNKSKVTISRSISELQSKGYITIQIKNGSRRIFINRKKLKSFDYDTYISNMDIAMSENDKGYYQKRIGSLIENDEDNKINTNKEENIKNEKGDLRDRFTYFLITSMDKEVMKYKNHEDFPSFFDPLSFYIETDRFLKIVFDTYSVEPSSLYSSFLDKIIALPLEPAGLDFFYKEFKDLLMTFLEELEESDSLKLLENPSVFDNMAPAYERFILDSYNALLKLYNTGVLNDGELDEDELARLEELEL